MNEHRHPEWLQADCVQKLDKVKAELSSLRDALDECLSFNEEDCKHIVQNVTYDLNVLIETINKMK